MKAAQAIPAKRLAFSSRLTPGWNQCSRQQHFRSVASTKRTAKMVLNHFAATEQTESHVCATPLSIFASGLFAHFRIKKILSWKKVLQAGF